MYMLKQLPALRIGLEDYAFIEQVCRQLLDEARHLADDGTPLYYPGGAYEACWTRDLCYMVEGAGHLMPEDEILSCIDYLLAGQREDGTIPDRVRADGTAIYFPGPDDAPMGTEPPTDNAQFMVKLVDAYVRLSGDFSAFLLRREQLYEAMEQVPRSDDGLVFIDPNHPHSPYGFTDTVAKTGKVLFSSLLYWEACRRLATLCAQAEYHEEAHEWYEQAEHVINSLPQFYDKEYGLYRAASEDCRQLDLWGSAYAAVIRAASKKQTQLVGRFFCERAEIATWRGHVRHLPVGESWERLLRPVEPETYQNGAFWAVPSGWVAQAMATVDQQAARQLISDLLGVWRTEGVYECISPHASPKGPGYVASAAAILACVGPSKNVN